jgi:CheY-like chemotaxis protein
VDSGWILVAEDNTGDVSLIRHALIHHKVNLTVVVMKDGESVCCLLDDLDSNEGKSPALILLDLNLPRRSGRELLERIRASEALREVPVVVFSSSQAKSDREDSLRRGANLYITKPSDLDTFLEIGKTLKNLIADSQ